MISKGLACPEPIAAEIAADIFRQGGTAIEAVVAAAFGQAVTNPLACGIGGAAYIMVMREGWTEPRYFNAHACIGSLVRPDVFEAAFLGRSPERLNRYLLRSNHASMGYQSIATPGFVRGMIAVLNIGDTRMTWQELVSPSATVASEGFAVYPYLETYYTFEGPERPGHADVFRKLAADPVVRERYLPGGQPPPVGFVLRQPEYGRTLRRIAQQGPEEFYLGTTGREIANDLGAHQAFVTGDDLAAYYVETAAPVKGTFRELTVYTSPPPGFGTVLLTMLNLVEEFDLETMEWNGPEYIDTIAWASRTAFADCLPYLGDPAFVTVPVDWLISKDRLLPVKRERALEGACTWASRANTHTTHVTTADMDGNIVSITHSIGSVAGAGVITPSLGFFYNNLMEHFNPLRGYHNSIAAGKRSSGACPSIIFRGNRPWFAIGSSGGSRLITAVFQTILNVAVFRMSLQEAVSAPRIHSELGRRIYVEPVFQGRVAHELERRGYDLEITDYMACNQAVGFTVDGVEVGSDPRGGGGVGVL